MTADTLIRCKCGDPMLANGTCGHCDRGSCSTNHQPGFPAGKECVPKHDWDICTRCQALATWEPWAGYNLGKKEG